MGDFGFETTDGDGHVRVALTGEFDLATVPGVEDELRRIEAGEPPVLVIDLTGLRFMDSSGLRSLVMADDRARAAGRRVVIVHGPPQVRRVFEITRLDERLELVDDLSTVSSS